LAYYFLFVVKNYSVHPERSSRYHIFEPVINKDGLGWVDPSLLDHMLVEPNIRLVLVDSYTKNDGILVRA
jgi:hypothetical protein